jgi:hypothetical protein
MKATITTNVGTVVLESDNPQEIADLLSRLLGTTVTKPEATTETVAKVTTTRGSRMGRPARLHYECKSQPGKLLTGHEAGELAWRHPSRIRQATAVAEEAGEEWASVNGHSFRRVVRSA